MASIENRIVQMQFDNIAFERKLSETMRSLDKLNQTIANAGSKNGLANLQDSVKGFNLDPLATSIEGVSAKFLAMSTIAVTVLSTIVSKALDAGLKIASAVSLEPLTKGFEEYSTQIGAIQTILANTDSKGTTLDQVNSALDTLNEYSDKTIYNFTEMTRNIGTFTAAGVDLDTSVQSIKGIANLAAISGSNSQQASTAMYQLSQAIASGSVKLMDWNSVVNAGMGGEIFQKALFDTGVAMQSIADVPMGTSFEEWKASGNTFRASLESGWLSAEVLTATLSQFTGELNKEQIMAQGFTEGQADEIMRLGTIGVEAATKVRTLKALIDTTKESLASGWAQSFRTIFGDFNEATDLFTQASNAIGGVIQRGADARNALLQGWADLHGRLHLINGIQLAFKALAEVFAPIREAFKEIFPPLTAQRLLDLTIAFADLMQALRPSEETVAAIKRIFTGFFAALEIGWTVLKETGRFIADLFTSLSGAGSGKFLEFVAKIGDFFTGLNEKLVAGGGIVNFFTDLGEKAKVLVERIKDLVEPVKKFISQFDINTGGILGFFTDIQNAAKEFFDSFSDGAGNIAGGAVDRLESRFGGLGTKLGNLWEPLSNAFGKITEVLDGIWEVIRDWFENLADKMEEVFGPGEFDAVVDAINVGLIGGIALALKKFISGDGINFGGGLFNNITEAFGELTDVLGAMEASLKAEALLDIAKAVGILVASLVVLSLIDSAALSKALAAMAVGFGQLMGSFALMNSIGFGPASAAKLALMAGGMVLLAGAMLILSVAVKILATMDWDEMLKGLVASAGILVILAGAATIFSNASGPMLRGSLSMIAMGIALNILAFAVKQFADMEWEAMGQGLTGIAGGLLAMGLAIGLMPASSILSGGGLILAAVSLIILAEAVAKFAELEWGDMIRGLTGVGLALLAVGGAVSLMPPSLPLIGLGLILVASALDDVLAAVVGFGEMSWEEIARGLIGLGGALIILSAGLTAMTAGALGAVALLLVVPALKGLVEVIEEFGDMDTGKFFKGLGLLAAGLLTIGAASLALAPASVVLLAFGAALIFVGVGMALIGIGVQALAKGFEIMAKAGGAGLDVFLDLIDALIERIPTMVSAVAKGLLEVIQTFLDAAPPLVKALGVVIEQLLVSITEFIPEAVEAIKLLTLELIAAIREVFPEYVAAGFEMLMAILKGIRDNIGEIVAVVSEIITNFLDAFALEVPAIIDSVYGLVIAIIEGVIAKLVDVASYLLPKGLEFLGGLLTGIQNFATDTLLPWFVALPGNIVAAIGDLSVWLIQKGLDLLWGFLEGVKNFARDDLIPWITALPGKIVEWVGDLFYTLRTKGSNIISGFLTGIVNFATDDLMPWIKDLPNKIVGWVGDVFTTLKTKGVSIISGFYNGVINFVNEDLLPWFQDLPNKIVRWIGNVGNILKDVGRAIIRGLWNGMKEVWDDTAGWLGGLAAKIPKLKGPPSYDAVILEENGKLIIQGLQNGMMDEWDVVAAWLSSLNPAEELTPGFADRIGNLFEGLVNGLGNMDELSPVITPVLDLSQVQKDASGIDNLMPKPDFLWSSKTQAERIVTEGINQEEQKPAPDEVATVVNFVQNNNSPEALSTSDIYRQTKNLLSLEQRKVVPAEV